MSKELPYFQFEPAQYLAGDIQNCSYAAQGLFVNILSVYWAKGCELSIGQIERRFNEKELTNELIEENVIKIEDGKIDITFLSEAKATLINRKAKLSEAGRRGGKKSKRPDNKPPLNEDKATPKHIEEIRRDKIRKEENTPPIVPQGGNDGDGVNFIPSNLTDKKQIAQWIADENQIWLDERMKQFSYDKRTSLNQIYRFLLDCWDGDTTKDQRFKPLAKTSIGKIKNRCKDWMKYNPPQNQESAKVTNSRRVAGVAETKKLLANA